MKIALVPFNPIVGKIEANCDNMIHWIDQAIEQDCFLIIFPEMSLIGYPPKDYLFYKILLEQQSKVLSRLKRKSKKITIVVGGFSKNKDQGAPFTNEAFILQNGQIYNYSKQLLPNYDVFDEHRYFEPGHETLVLKIGGKKFGFSICEDIWFKDPLLKSRYHENPITAYDKLNLDYLINISASPFELDKVERRRNLIPEIAKDLNCHVIYLNQMGANDDLVFDGGALISNAKGELIYHAPEFVEDLFIFETEDKNPPLPKQKINTLELLEKALVTGIRDYIHKTGFSEAVIGLSGGIDSALVTYLATKALGAQNVLAVNLPSRYSSKGSVEDSEKLAQNLGITIKHINIESIHHSFEDLFDKIFDSKPNDITAQNIQARIRANILMAISNNSGKLLLNTTNKSEMAMGYGTLYGDMCGALAVISDLTKTQVYALANYINRESEIIPIEIIKKAPTAELKPDQRDIDTLPSYDALDPMIEDFIDHHRISAELKIDSYDPKHIMAKILQNEYKRYQAPLGLKVSGKAFGVGRRIPIAGKLVI